MDVDEQLLNEPLAEASVAFAYLFGSTATGAQRPGSDLDLAIMPGRELGLLDEQRLAAHIARTLNIADVDLVRLDRAGLELRGKVVQEGRLAFSADAPRRVAFEVRTRAEYLDYLPTLRAHTRRYIRQVAERGTVMVDPDRIRRLLGALSDYRDRLAELRELATERYVEEQALAGRYLVQVCAQSCIDISNHVIASEGWRVPADFRDVFTVLEENGVLEAQLAERMRALADLRNRLVHVYEEIDDAIVHAALGAGLDDLDAFASSVAQLVEDEQDAG